MARLEIACFNRASAIVAKTTGVDRIEFCAGASVGGTTPDIDSLADLEKSMTKSDGASRTTPVFVMIRPRGGNFVYSDAEFEQMKADIGGFLDQGQADGFVFGVLIEMASGKCIDVARNQELVKLAGGLPCTFHRAFDDCADLDRSLEDVIQCGFQTVLTSGGQSSIMDKGARGTLADLVARAEGRVVIMPGGGVRSSNVAALVQDTNAQWFHSSALVRGGDVADQEEIRRLKELVAGKP